MGAALSSEDVFAPHTGTDILDKLHLTAPRTCPQRQGWRQRICRVLHPSLVGNKCGLMFSLGDFGASGLGVLSWLFFLSHFVTEVGLLLV